MAQGGFNDPKVQFHQEIKTLEKQIGDTDVKLASFIVSVTPFEQIGLWDKKLTQKDFEDHHIVFQSDKSKYIEEIFQRIIKD